MRKYKWNYNCNVTSSFHFFKIQFLRAHVSFNSQAKWEQGNLNFFGRVFCFYSVSVWSIWKLDLNGENEVLVTPETNHWLMNFPTFLFLFILFIYLFIYLLAPKSGRGGG